MPLNEYDQFLQDNPPALPKANPYDAAVQDQAQADQTRLRGSMFVAGQTTPDRAAQIIKLSERTKIPAPVVERNFDELSKKFDLTDDEYGSIIKNNPTLTTWLGDPTNAAVSRDDLTTLQRIENTVRSFTRGWTRADSGGELADLLFKEVEQGTLSPSEAARRDALKAQQQTLGQADQANGLPEYLAGTTGYSMRQMGSSLYWGAYGAGAGGVAGAVAGSVLPGVGTAAGGAAGMISGGLTAAAQYSYRMETGFAYDDLRSMKDINGNTIDPMIARQAARGVGMINAVIEVGSDALLATLVPGFGALTAGLRGDAAKAAVMGQVRAALANPSKRAIVMQALGKIGSMASIEGLEEFVQAFVGAGGREIAQGVSGQEFKPDSFTADLADASRQALDATVGTFFTFAPIGGAHYYVGARQAARAQQQAAFFSALGGDMKDSKTFERLPQKMQDFIEQATKDGPIETAYVDPSAFVTYFQNQGVDPRAAAEEIIGDVTQYDHALLSGEQIEIPMGRYATRIAPTEANAYFANEMRLAPDAMNAREATEWETKQAEETKAALAAMPQEEQDAVKEQIKQQLIDAGTEPATAETQATAFATTAAVMAARSGQSVEQVLAPYGLKISRPSLQEQITPEGQRALDQARTEQTNTPEFKSWFSGSKVVDDNQKPLVVYHGTREPWTQARTGEERMQRFDHFARGISDQIVKNQRAYTERLGGAVWFTDDEGVAEGFRDATNGEGGVMPVYLSMKNPLDLRSGKTDLQEIERILSEVYGEPQQIEATYGPRLGVARAVVWDNSRVIQWAREHGYDGLIHDDTDILGRHTHTSYVVFNPNQIKSTANRGTFSTSDANIYNQRGRVPKLIIQHNLTGENLLHALRMGGLVAPSLAITKAADPMSNFGEITLIGRKEMADPRGYARPKVFGADVYSPRYPDVHYKFDAAGEKVLRNEVERFESVTGERYFDLDELQKKGAKYLQTTGTMMAAFLTEKGIAFERVKNDDKYRADMDTRRAMENTIYDGKLRPEFERFTEAFLGKMNPAERIFKGFNYNGNRTYAAHTIDNVIRMLKKDLRGGESNTNIYGVGQLRAKFTPQFKSVSAIQAAEDRIVSDAEFEKVKAEIDEEFFSIVEALKPYYKHPVELFRFPDTVLAVIEDGARIGLDKAAADYGFNALPDDAKDQIRQFYTHLRNLPTEYFEAKILRGVGVSEFAAAAVPHDAPSEVIQALRDHGVQIEQYARNDLEDRKRAVAALTGSLGESVLFQGDTIDGLTGELVPNPPYYSALVRQVEGAKIDKAPAAQWKAYINSLASKGVKKEEILVSGVLDWLDVEGRNTVALYDKSTGERVLGDSSKAVELRGTELVALNEGQELRKVDARVTRQQVLDYLEQNHVRVEEKILGEPRTSIVAQPKAAEGLPAGYSIATREQVESFHHVGRNQFYVVNAQGSTFGSGMTEAEAVANARDFIDGVPEGYQIEVLDNGEFNLTDPDGDDIAMYETRQEAVDAAIEHFEENGITDEQVEEKARELWEEGLPEEARSYAQDSDYVNQVFEVTFRPPSFKIVEMPADAFRKEPAYGVRKLAFDDLPPQMEDDNGAASREQKGMPDDIDEFNEMWPEGPTESWATREEFATEAEARAWAESQTDDNGFEWHDGDPIWTARDPENPDDVDDYESWGDISSDAERRRDSRYQMEVDSYIANADFSDSADHYEREARALLEEERGDGRPRGRSSSGALRDPNAPIPVRHAKSWQSIGGRDYREIVLSVPGIEPYSASDSTHFGTDTGGRTVAWVRAKVHDDANGTPTLFAEEFQSQRAQHGKEEGFKRDTPATPEEMAAIAALEVKRDDLSDKMREILRPYPGGSVMTVDDIIQSTERSADDKQKAVAVRAQIDDLVAQRDAVNAQIETLNNEAHGGPVPTAPFVKDTQSWTALGMKRLLRYAVDHGITQVAWTQGIEQVERYQSWLRKRVDSIAWTKIEGGIEIKAKQDSSTLQELKLSPKALEGAIGKDMAQRIINDPAQAGELKGKDITIDDLGMAFYYGNAEGMTPEGKPSIVSIVAGKLVKGLGGEGITTIPLTVKEGDNTYEGAPGFKITPEMAQKARGGFPMFQTGGDVKRGRIRFGLDRKFYIDLLEGANLSTFIHESGHFWLEVFGDIVEKLKAQDQATLSDTQRRMVADYDTLLKWLGAETRMDITTEQHEQFARGIEKYFMLGQSPSAEMRSVFARVRAWMLSIYRSLGTLRVAISPEVKDVFDRMVATDEQIAAAEAEAEIVPLFEDEQKFIAAGFDQAFVDAYRDQVRKARDVAEQQLQTKLMATLTREREAWFKSERIRVRNEVAAEVNARREQIALSVLTRGQMPDGSAPAIEGKIKLNRAEVDAVAGEGAWKRVPRGTTAKDGLALQVAADLFGFASGDELIKALNIARPASAVIEEATDAKMKELHGDLLVDGGIVDAAREAVQNGERVKVIEAELRALSRLRALAAPAVAIQARQGAQAQAATLGAIRGSIPPLAVIRQAAAGRISATRVRDIRPMQFLNAARKASQEAKVAAGRQEYQAAIAGKQRELLNIELYRAAMAAQEEVAKTAEYMQRFADNKTRSRIAKAGQDYLDQIDGFLDRYDFAHVSLKALDRRKNLAAWVAQKEKDGEPVNLPDGVVVEQRISYKDMTVEELRGVRDSVKHIEHLARLKNRLLTAKRTKDLQAAIAELDASIRENVRSPKGIKVESRLPQDEALRMMDSWFALHRKLSEFAREMDGWKDGGLAWEYFVRPVNEAGDAETVMSQEANQKLKALFDLYQGHEITNLYRKEQIQELGEPVTRMAQLMMALNWGNLDSRQKLMDGYGMNQYQVEAVLNRLDRRDWQFVQGVWDFINSYWPLIEAKEKRVNGIAPEKVVPAPVQTQFGEMPGGYFPLKYDDRQSPQAHGNRVKEIAEQMMKGAFTRASTRRGHTHERVAGVKLPIRLDFGVIFEHAAEVIHDLTHHEMLIDMNRLLGSKEIGHTIIEQYGDIVYKQLQETIRDVAAGAVPAIGAFEKSLNWVRTGMTVAALGWNVFTSLLQPFGLTQSMQRIGVKWVGKGIARWVGDAAHMENTVAWIKAKSPMMTNRIDTQLREINELRNEIGLTTGKLGGWIDEALRDVTMNHASKQGLVDSFFWLIYKGQQIADVPTWLGAYEKAMADSTNDETRAIALADQAVLDSQGGGQVKDLAGIQRGGPLLKIWTAFYSYFNVTWNRNVESVKRTHFTNPVEVGRLAVDMLLLNALPATLGWMTRQALVGKDDDKEVLLMQLLQENLSYLFGMMIGLRELGSVIQGYMGYSGPAGARFFSSVAKLIQQTGQGEADAAFWRSLNETAGILLHYPAGQVRRTVEGFNAMMEGETKNPLALLVGPRKE